MGGLHCLASDISKLIIYIFDLLFYFCLFDLLVLNLRIGWLEILQNIYVVVSMRQILHLMLSSKAYKWLIIIL
jgi:hypothetical protein